MDEPRISLKFFRMNTSKNVQILGYFIFSFIRCWEGGFVTARVELADTNCWPLFLFYMFKRTSCLSLVCSPFHSSFWSFTCGRKRETRKKETSRIINDISLENWIFPVKTCDRCRAKGGRSTWSAEVISWILCFKNLRLMRSVKMDP